MRTVAILLVVVAILAAGCGLFDPDADKVQIKYTVTGSCSQVDITMENEDGGVSQYSNRSVPWTYEFPDKISRDRFLYIAAQNQGQTGSVTVKIYRDGDVIKSSTSSGAYVIATASGTS